MKKAAVLLITLAVILLCTIPAAAEGIAISSENGDKISLFSDIKVTGQSSGNVITVLGDITVEGMVSGQVVAVFGDVKIDGQVHGQVVNVFGNTVITGSSMINGDVINIGSLDKGKGAMINGQEVRILGESMNLDITSIVYLRLVIMLLFTIAVLIIGLLLLVISRKQYYEMALTIEKDFGRKLSLGVLSFLGASVLFLLLLVTLIAPLIYFIILVISAIPACIFAGKIILRYFSSTSSIYLEFITGLITITLIKLLVIFLVPSKELLLGLLLSGLLDMLVFSTGLGIHMYDRYARK